MAIDRIKNGITCKLDQDLFGERFFCDMTQLLKYARQFAHSGDHKYYKEIDIKNSQFYFFSQLMDENVLDEYLINRELNKSLHKHYKQFRKDLMAVKHKPDMLQMVKDIQSGTLYDKLAKRLGISRKDAKNDYFFKAAFSKKNVHKKAKDIIKKDYPSFVKLIEKTNNYNTPKLLPSILQKVESRILLDEIAIDLFDFLQKKEGQYPFFSVHDAFYLHPDVHKEAVTIVENSFRRLGLQIPKMDY